MVEVRMMFTLFAAPAGVESGFVHTNRVASRA